MSRDPFLSSLAIVLDRVAVWAALTCASFLVLWSAVYERGLQSSWAEGLRQLGFIFNGQAEPVTRTLFCLTLAVALLATSAVCAWLFARWRRQGELRGTHVRGPRLEG